MNKKKFKNLHLSVSVLLILVIGLIYGFSPNKIIPFLADLEMVSNDLKNTFKAIMGLYVFMALFWSLGIINPKYWHPATLVNILFMFGLAIGRIVSLGIDGLPSESMLTGILLEVFLGIWGLISLKKFS